MKKQNPYGENCGESRKKYYSPKFRNKRLESAMDEEHLGKIALALLHPISWDDAYKLNQIALGGHIRKDIQDFLFGWLAENNKLGKI